MSPFSAPVYEPISDKVDKKDAGDDDDDDDDVMVWLLLQLQSPLQLTRRTKDGKKDKTSDEKSDNRCLENADLIWHEKWTRRVWLDGGIGM
jgi:hypothetical protein